MNDVLSFAIEIAAKNHEINIFILCIIWLCCCCRCSKGGFVCWFSPIQTMCVSMIKVDCSLPVSISLFVRTHEKKQSHASTLMPPFMFILALDLKLLENRVFSKPKRIFFKRPRKASSETSNSSSRHSVLLIIVSEFAFSM